MKTPSKRELNRRELLKLGAGAALVGSALPNRAFGDETCAEKSKCELPPMSGGDAIEAFPTGPFILDAFSDTPGNQLPIPTPLAPDLSVLNVNFPNKIQDSDGVLHQIMPSQLGLPAPVGYRIRLEVGTHRFTSSRVQALVDAVDGTGAVIIRAGTVRSRLPDSTIYGFNGTPIPGNATFPGPMIYARYGRPVLVRFENHLDENPSHLDRQDFGDLSFLTHLHNGHTAPESDGNPHHKPCAYKPGEWVENLYLNYPAGGDPNEMQSFFWFHDHREGHTGANVYKGMVGLYPIYDPLLDPGDETQGLRLPGVPNATTGRIDYDIPLAIYDCRLDDGATPHKDFHNGSGETHPEWWGMTFFRHFPNHGFVGDIFTVNGAAYPVLHVNRRKYRLRFLDASVARIYEFKLMRGTPKAAPGTLGQWQLPDGQQCMRFTQIATEGGLLPFAIVRDSFQLWPAHRREFIVDFSKYLDENPTKPGEAIYLTNILPMSTGRGPDSPDPSYRVPVLKIIIGDDAPDNSLRPTKLRDLPRLPSCLQNLLPGRELPAEDLPRICPDLTIRSFELQRSGFGGEIEWLINGRPFETCVPLAFPAKSPNGEIWILKNGGGGWVHPMHIHNEEFQVIARNRVITPNPADPAHPDDRARQDTAALAPGEEVVVFRRFRDFTGRYVAHCHNLAHEDHSMMFGWTIV